MPQPQAKKTASEVENGFSEVQTAVSEVSREKPAHRALVLSY